MAKKESYLKDQYAWKLWLFIVFHIAVFSWLLISPTLSFKELTIAWKKLTLKDGILYSIAPLLTIAFNGFFSSDWKPFLIFWRIKNALPGCRAFTKLGPIDQRVNMTILEQKHGSLPEDPTEQNRLWYKIYKSQSDKLIVKKSHKDYLFMRDITAISVFLLIFFGLSGFFLMGNAGLSAVYLFVLLFQYFFVSVAARNYGNRFVCNVLAEESLANSNG